MQVEFEFISKHNLDYANYRLTFGPFWSVSNNFIYSVWFGLLQSTLVFSVQFGLLCPTLVQLGPYGLLQSIQCNSVYLVHLDHFTQFWSIQSSLVLFGAFRSIPSTSVHSVHFGLFGPSSLSLITSVQFGVPT